MPGKDELIAAIDIGTTKVSTIIGRLKKNNIVEIKGYGIAKSRGIKKGLVIDINEVTKSILDSVETAEKSSNLFIDNAYIGVTGKHITFENNYNEITIASPNKIVRKIDIDRLISLTNRINLPSQYEVIHTIIKQFVADGEKGIEDPIGLATERLGVELLIIFGSSSIIRNVINCVKAANLEIEDIIIEALASSEAVLSSEEKESGVILLDIGGGTTDVAVYKNKKMIFTYCLPVGGDLITNDISIGLNIPFTKAEEIKKRFANVDYSFPDLMSKASISDMNINTNKTTLSIQLYNIVSSRVKEMMQIIKDKIDEYGITNSIPCGLVITGGSAQTKGILKMASSVFNMPSRIGICTDVEGPSEVINNPIFSTGVGILKYAFQVDNFEDIDNINNNKSRDNLSFGERFRIFISKILKGDK
ncbi:MAG TPA: cell division protein FtsA [Actinobacteria bacterium]|nr:cell division protein FtsA [Actinomycetota bacterium]